MTRVRYLLGLPGPDDQADDVVQPDPHDVDWTPPDEEPASA